MSSPLQRLRRECLIQRAQERRLRNLKKRMIDRLEGCPSGLELSALRRVLHAYRFPRYVWDIALKNLIGSGWIRQSGSMLTLRTGLDSDTKKLICGG